MKRGKFIEEERGMDLFVYEDEPFLFKLTEWNKIYNYKDKKLDSFLYTNVLADALTTATNGCVLCFKRFNAGKTKLKIEAYCKHKMVIEGKIVNCRKYR